MKLLPDRLKSEIADAIANFFFGAGVGWLIFVIYYLIFKELPDGP